MPLAKPVKPSGSFGRRVNPPQAPGGDDPKPTVMIMAYDWGTGAHAVVSDRLSQALQSRGCKVVIFTDKQTKERMNGFTSIHGRLEVVTHPNATIEQPSYFETAYRKHQPSVIITEHYPMDGSCSLVDSKMINPCLKRAKEISQAEGWPLQVHALVRDIPDAEVLPSQYWLEHYDSFLVRGDKKLYNYATHFGGDKQWDAIKDKILYVGYAADAKPALTKNGSVLVSLGGGNLTGDRKTYDTITHTIDLLRDKNPELANKHWHLFAPPKLCQNLRKEATFSRSTITIEPFGPGFQEAMQKADMVICRGGMTAIESVAQGLPTLIIPRQYEYGGEQKTRAAILADKARHLVRCCEEKSGMIPNDLVEPMQNTYALRHVTSSPPFSLNGHEKAADAIIALSQGKSLDEVRSQRAPIAR